MIFDKLNNSNLYYSLNSKFQKGFEFLLNSDINKLNDGTYRIVNDEIFTNIQTITTKSKEDKKWEAHRKYIDIQYIIDGTECMGFGNLKDFTRIIFDYDSSKDVIFLSGSTYNYINLKQGDFIIFYPDDVHAPMLYDKTSSVVKKAIVKIQL